MAKTPEKQAYPTIHALIVAAGSGTRTGDDTPKQYWNLMGKSVLAHSIEKFKNIEVIETINVVINAEHKTLYETAMQAYEDIHLTIGGAVRKDSVYNALNDFKHFRDNDIIVIHDAARPLISSKDITAVIDAAIQHNAVTLSTKVTDTIFDDTTKLDRTKLRSVQTPQAFLYSTLKNAHENFKDNEDFTDDAGIVMADNHHVEFVEASSPNIKITTVDDFDIVKIMMTENISIRTASGFDVHAFAESLERPLILGGIEIKHDRSLIGHSDADVILHTITDAVLGTINQGDIGTHFPPSEDKWKGKDSSFFLSEATKKLSEHHATLEFIDITVICEEPKIGKYRKSIQTRIAEILDISKELVSIKATTTEGLGFTGRKEGIACQATATVKIRT